MGEAVELPDSDPERLARAVERETDERPTVRAPAPGPVVKRCSPLTEELTLSVGPALAAAARSLGLSAPQDDALATVDDRLASCDPTPADGRAARRQIATANGRERTLRERVSTLRGRLAVHRERGESSPALERRLEEAVAELTEVRTDRLAAEQRLDQVERRARPDRDQRERRLRLEDRRDNLRRGVRSHFVDRLADDFADALRSVPGPDPDDEGAFDPRSVSADLTGALAVVRLAAVSAPVVVDCGRFESARAAVRTLSAPVIRTSR